MFVDPGSSLLSLDIDDSTDVTRPNGSDEGGGLDKDDGDEIIFPTAKSGIDKYGKIVK